MKYNSTTQSDTNMNFDGMENMKPASLKRFAGNAWSGHSNDGRLVNKGRGPTKGNQGGGVPGQPGATKSVTQDRFRAAPTDGVPSVKINPDRINIGRQDRGAGGVTAKSPSNPDKIRVGQNGGGSYNSATPGRTPATRKGDSNFNFGPKSQY